MTTPFTTLFLFSFISASIFSQSKVISGRIISEDLEPLPAVSIHTMDTTLIARADLDGYFKLKVAASTDALLLGFVGYEWTSIKLSADCNTLEIVMMVDVIYDFMSLKKVDRLRIKRFKKLPHIHQLAYEQGVFKTEYPCYRQTFEYYSDRRLK